MTAIGSLNAGARITASAMQGIAPLAVVKPTDQSVTSSTTLVNDNALVVAVAASASYLFFCYLDYEGASAGDLKYEWTVPASATLRFGQIGQTTASAATVASTNSDSTVYAIGTDAAATLNAVTMIGSLVVSSTAGNLQLQWAQNASSATATIVHAQSFLALWRVT
jgi:hypothetical protein